MTARDWLDAPGMRPALAALAVAAAVAAWSLAGLARADARPATAVVAPPAIAVRGIAAGARPPARLVELDDDLFSPLRSPPARRYRPPGTADDAPESGTAPPASPVVLGTVVSTGPGSFATVRLGADAPKLVRVGEAVGPYTVRRIERGRVTFSTSAGERIVVRAEAPFSSE